MIAQLAGDGLGRVEAVADKVPFQARGVRIVDPGWTRLYPPPKKKKTAAQDSKEQGETDAEQEQTLPLFQKGESGPHAPWLKEGKTQPPRRFTENTLLGAMETAGRLVEEEELKEALKERGLGTPATRAGIIETLLKRNYIRRDKKSLEATDLGRCLAALVQDENLKSVELTGQWEAQLKQIEQKQLAPEAFSQQIAEYTRRILDSSDPAAINHGVWGDCPRCGRPVIEGKRGYGCSGWKEGCEFVLWREYRDLSLEPRRIRALLQRRVSTPPLKTEAGEVILYLTPQGCLMEIPAPQSAADSPPAGKQKASKQKTGKQKADRSPDAQPQAGEESFGACPACGKQVSEQPKSYSCSGWREGCKFVIWKTISGKKISKRTAKTLLEKGRTSVLKGFKSKAGKTFEARLELREGEVKLGFENAS